MISEAISTVTEAADTISEFAADLEMREQTHREATQGQEDDEAPELALEMVEEDIRYMERAADSRRRAHGCGLAMLADGVRIRVVLGQDSPLAGSHEELTEAAQAWWRAIAADGESQRAESQKRSEEEARLRFGARMSRFEELCRAQFTVTQDNTT